MKCFPSIPINKKEKVDPHNVNQGINVQVRNKKGQTAITVAKQHQSRKIVELLMAHGAIE